MTNDDYTSLEQRVRRLEELSRHNIPNLPDPILKAIQVGENPVRAIRRYRLLTQKDLSELTGLGENHISNIENGAQINLRTAKKLADALEVRIDEIS